MCYYLAYLHLLVPRPLRQLLLYAHQPARDGLGGLDAQLLGDQQILARTLSEKMTAGKSLQGIELLDG